MPPSADRISIRIAFASYWRALREVDGARLWLAASLFVLISVLEASGLLLLLPLLRSVGVPVSSGTGELTRWVGFFATLPFGIGMLMALLVAVKGAQAVLRAVSGWVNLRLETEFTDFLRARFYRAVMEASWLFVTRQRSSDVTQALVAELPKVGVTTHLLLQLLGLLVVAFAHATVAWMLSPGMTALALAAGGIVVLGLRRLEGRAHELAAQGFGRRTEMTAIVTEHLAGVKIAKSHGQEERHYRHFLRTMRTLAEHGLRTFRAQALTQIWLQFGAALALAIFVWLAVEFGQVATARLLVMAFAFSRLLSHVTSIQTLWHNFTLSLPAFALTERLRAQFAAAAEPPLPPQPARIALRREVRLERVSFSYDPAGASTALHDVDLVIPARSVIALCGPSGAGKSTTADLVLGLLAPATGRVTIDGEPPAGARLHEWRRSIGYVPQETFLFHDTVRANLLWARPEASEAELRAALDSAAALDFVTRLPQGLDTVVGDRGVRLSGGERQRLALARALLRQPTLLVLDEATSSLDAHNERLVQDAIEKLHGELTILLIAHRLSTVRMADRIAVFEAGTIVETGTWDELCGRERGAFRRLVAADAHA